VEEVKGGDWEFSQNVVVIKMRGKEFFIFGGRGMIEDLYLAFTRF
jgi:hypothetical protein